MGYVRHEAMLFEGIRKSVEALHADIVTMIAKHDLTTQMLGEIREVINGYTFFTLYPDGSKEGWGSSNDGDLLRAEIKEHIKRNEIYVSWCSVQFSGDDGVSLIIDDGSGYNDEE